MKPIQLSLFQASGNTKWLEPKSQGMAIVQGVGWTKRYKGLRITGGYETDCQLMLCVRTGIERGLDSIPHDSVLRPYVDDIQIPEYTQAYMSENAQGLLQYVYRTVIYENIRLCAGNPGISPGLFDRMGDFASDAAFSYLCFIYHNDPNRIPLGPHVKSIQEEQQGIMSFHEVFSSRADIVAQYRKFLKDRFDANGLVDGCESERQYATDTKNRLVNPGNSLMALMQHVENNPMSPEARMEGDFNIDMDKLERMEKWSSDDVKEARESYYRDKDRALTNQANGKIAKEAIHASLQGSEGTTFDPTVMAGAQLNATPHTATPTFEDSQAEQVHDDVSVIAMESDRFPTFEFKEDEAMYTPNQYTHMAPQGNFDPYNQTGLVTLPGGGQTTLPQGQKLLTDYTGRLVVRSNGSVIAVPVNSIDCRLVNVSMSDNNQPIYDHEGMPIIYYVGKQGEIIPVPLTAAQREQAKQMTQQHMTNLGHSQPQVSQHQATSPQTKDYWAEMRNQLESQNVNAPDSSAAPSDDLSLPVWKRQAVHEEASPSAEVATEYPQPSIGNFVKPLEQETTPNVEIEAIDDLLAMEGDGLDDLAVDPAETTGDLEMNPTVVIGNNPFIIIDENGESYTAVTKDDAFVTPVWINTFNDRLVIDTRRFSIVYAVNRNGVLHEMALLKNTLEGYLEMDRSKHDPYFMERKRGEETSLEVHSVDMETEDLPDAKVELSQTEISSDDKADLVNVVLDISREAEKPVVFPSEHFEIISGASVDRQLFLDFKDTDFEDPGAQMARLVAMLSVVVKDCRPASEFLESKLSSWWTQALSTRLSQVEPITVSGFTSEETVAGMFEYLAEENLSKEALDMFERDFNALFNLEMVYVGKEAEYAGIGYDDVVIDDHSGDNLALDFMNGQKTLGLRRLVTGYTIAAPDLNMELTVGEVSPRIHASTYGILNSAFKEIDAVSESTQFTIRLANKLGQLVTVSRDKTSAGYDRFFVIDVV